MDQLVDQLVEQLVDHLVDYLTFLRRRSIHTQMYVSVQVAKIVTKYQNKDEISQRWETFVLVQFLQIRLFRHPWRQRQWQCVRQ